MQCCTVHLKKCHVTVYKKCYCRTVLRDTGTNFHRVMVATAPGKKTPRRAPPCEELDLPYNVKFVSVQKITFVLRKINKYCCHQSCTFWPQYANKSFVSWGFAPHPIGGAYSDPSDPLAVYRGLLLKGWEGRERTERDGEFVVCPRKKKEKSVPMITDVLTLVKRTEVDSN